MLTHKQTHFSLIVILMLLTGLLLACAPEPVTRAAEASETGTITVIGRGQTLGNPDQAQAQVGVEIFADTVQAAVNENETTIQAIMKALAAQGIAPKDIQTTNYNLWAEQIYGERGPEGIAGYRVTHQVNITVRDLSKLGDVLAAVIEAGANNIFGLSFSLADPATLEAEAREKAVANAHDRAAALARLGQVELGGIKMISEVIGQPPQPFFKYGADDAAVAEVAAPSISSGQLSYEVQVQVTFGIK